MKKILYLITQSELGGAQRYIFDLARGLKNDFEISVAFGEPGDQGELARLLDAASIKYYVLPHLKRAISPFNDLIAIKEIKNLIKKIKPDIVHLNSSKMSILGTIAARIARLKTENCNLKTVYTVHGWVFNEPLSFCKKRFYYYAEKWTARRKDKIICIDTLDYGIAKNELKIPETKLALIHHGINLSDYKMLAREEARKKLFNEILKTESPSSDKVVIGSIGNLYATKGFEYFIEALKLLKVPVRAVIIGEGSERKKLQVKSRESRVESRLFFAGRIENAAKLLPAFDLYVCSSVKEGFPYSILEAMAAGLPIVATKVGGIPDMIIDGENGMLCEPKNADQIAKKITDLRNNPDLKQKIAGRAVQDVAERFSYEKMVEATKEIYNT